MTKAFGYLRVSGKGQVQGHGFDRQREEIEAFASQSGLELAGFYQEEGVSGTTDETNRPAFQDMISDMLKNGVRTIVVEGLDRLARELRIQEQLVIFLAAKGITLISARTSEDVTQAYMADPMRKAMVQIQGVFAELEKSLLVKKLRKARDQKRQEDGKCEGRKSYKEAAPAVVAEIRRLRRRRRDLPRRTWDEIAAELNRLGHRTLTGREFNRFSAMNAVK